MKRIKWNNVLKTILFLVALYIVIYDFYYIVISPFVTSYITTWSWIGIITNFASLYYVIEYTIDFNKQMKKGVK